MTPTPNPGDETPETAERDAYSDPNEMALLHSSRSPQVDDLRGDRCDALVCIEVV